MGESARAGGYVFISYVREDSADVDRLQQILAGAGLPTWRDTVELRPGQDWAAQVRDAIAGDALVFLACFSRSSGSRATSYQNEELTQAIDQVRLRPPGRTWLIPVRFDDCEIPDRDLGGGRRLASLQRADLFGESYARQADRLVEEIRGIFGPAATPAAPAPPVGPEAGRRRPVVVATSATVMACVIAAVVFAILRPARPAASSLVTYRDPGSSGVRSVAYGPGARSVAAGDANGTTYIRNLGTGKITMRLPDLASGGVNSVAFGPGGKILAAGDVNGKTYLWNLATGKIAKTLPDRGSKGVRSVAFGPGGRLAVGDENGSIYLRNPAGRVIERLPDPASKGVTSVAFRPGGRTLVAGDLNDTAYLWNLATQKVIERQRDPDGGGIYAVAVSPSGSTVALADGDGDAYIWNLAKDRITKTLPDPGGGGCYSVAFGQGGATLVTVDGNGNTYLWNVAAQKIIRRLREPPGNGDAQAAFSPSWSTIAIANNNSVYLWTY